MNFDEAFVALIGNEGGYSNHKDDPGLETMYGITAKVARQSGYMGTMKDLPLSTAKQIAKSQYWDAVRADEIPSVLRFDVFDASYNSGPKQAIKWLQRAVGATDDGVFGPGTMNAVDKTDPDAAYRRFNGYRLHFYTSLPTWSSFGKGWANRIADNLLRA
jgi:lysozyme family protein